MERHRSTSLELTDTDTDLSSNPTNHTKTPPSADSDSFPMRNDPFTIKNSFIKVDDVYLTPDSKDSMSESDIYKERAWTNDEMIMLNYLLYYDLTASSFNHCLPNLSLDMVCQKILSLNRQPSWTRGEVVLLADNLKGSNIDVHSELPLRSDSAISAKIDELQARRKQCKFPRTWSTSDQSTFLFQLEYDLTYSGLFEEFPDVEPEAYNQIIKSAPDWTPVEVAYLQDSKASQQESLESIAEEFPYRTIDEVKSKLDEVEPLPIHYDAELLHYVNHVTPCTLADLRLYFPGVPTRELVIHNNLRSTSSQFDIIEQAAKDNKSQNFVQAFLPFRSSSGIASAFKDFTNKYRKTRFKNSIDELVYYSQWQTSAEFGASSKRRRARHTVSDVTKQEEQPKQLNIYSRVPTLKDDVISYEGYKEQLRMEAECKRQKEIRDEQLRLEKLEKRKQQLKNPKPKIMKPSSKSSLFKTLNSLATEAAYFQSVTGDKQLIKDNEKRKRQQTVFVVPQFEDRQKLKSIMKKKVIKKNLKAAKATKSTTQKKGKKAGPAKSAEEDSEHSSQSEDDEDEDDEDDEEEEEVVSPFDPYDIKVDTTFDSTGRQLFADEIYKGKGKLPQFSFLSEDLETDILEDMKKDLFETDVLSAKIVLDFPNCYRSLGSTFPSLRIHDNEGNEILNPKNRIRLRTLLYPEHKEMFVLAQPKNNELNPLYEIQKFFQIHYCLYFSHSEKLKDVIYDDYCIALETAVSENKFADFMSVIDKWNSLMLALSPSYNGTGLLDSDINSEARAYTEGMAVEKPSLKLDVFFSEVCVGLEVVEQAVKSEKTKQVKAEQPQQIKAEEAQTQVTPESNGDAPHKNSTDMEVDEKGNDTITDMAQDLHLNDSTASAADLTDKTNDKPKSPVVFVPVDSVPVEYVARTVRPQSYIQDFLHRLQNKTDVSRYCMQQILIRVYARVVSTRSRELRKYKAFTAEVYGELLPSFVSEVLTKVDFKPNQRFYDLGSGVGNTSFQAALEFGALFSGGCELMEHASRLTDIQHFVLDNHLKILGLKPLNMRFALAQSFVNNEAVKRDVLNCDVLIVNNYLFDMSLNFAVGRLLYGLKPGTKIISLRNFITPRYKSTGDATIFDYLSVEKHEMSDFFSVSWTANKVPYYISTVEDIIQPQYL